MQTCFFAISGVLPRDEAIQKIKDAIQKTYEAKGEEVVRKQLHGGRRHAATPARGERARQAVDERPSSCRRSSPRRPGVRPPGHRRSSPASGDDAARQRLASATAPSPPRRASGRSGASPSRSRSGTRRLHPVRQVRAGLPPRRDPHEGLRPVPPRDRAPTFKSRRLQEQGLRGLKLTVQTAPEDCTGCGVCVEICPAKNKSRAEPEGDQHGSQPPLREPERNYDFFLDLPEFDRTRLNAATVKGSQMLQPLFEYSGACAGCGETPYVKLISQLFGDRMRSSRTPPAAPRSTAATCRPRRGR
jgi:pyruvate-ferredoxin/flavodoxin oxidoreductase